MTSTAPSSPWLLLSRFFGSTAAKNAASNFVALGWQSMMSMLSIPIYIHLLGRVEWGIVAACVNLQLIANLVDAGFSQIVPRWVAKEAGDGIALRSYLLLFRRIYVGLGLLVFSFLQLGAGYLAHNWFQVAADRADTLEVAIRIISFQILFQFVNNLHIGFWYGLQKQVLANIRTCCFGTLKHAATIGVLFFTFRQAWAYASVFAMVALLELLINGLTVHRMMAAYHVTKEEHHLAMASFFREVLVLSGGILVGLTVSQLDRVILSRTLPVEEFGIYTVVVTLALAALQLQSPFTRAYFPLLVQDFQSIGWVATTHMKRLVTGTFVASTLPALLASLFAAPILQLWLHNPRIVEIGERPLQLLLLAVATNTLYNCIYQVIVATGRSHLVLKFNLVALAVAGVVVLIVGSSTGLLLGSIIWLTTTLTQLLLGLLWFSLQRRPPAIPKEHGA